LTGKPLKDDEKEGDFDCVPNYLRNQSSLDHIRWVFPIGPKRLITRDNDGILKTAWFDITKNLADGRTEADEDVNGLLTSVRQLDGVIATEVEAGVKPERIVIGGFSQGAVMAILTGLTGTGSRTPEEEGRENENKWSLGGVLALDGYIPIISRFNKYLSPNARDTPLFWGHGVEDTTVPYEDAGVASVHGLSRLYTRPNPASSTPPPPVPIGEFDHPNAPLYVAIAADTKMVPRGEGGGWIEFHSFAGVAHEIPEYELPFIQRWLERVVPSSY